ncbi:redox-sensing transcriptional repressor Rex [Peptoniphilus lacydonensis]|uniref:redox-sensing transcriptional repressor Rex n=1 Tax=Peptoniphilus lacydonensis TaxID=1673725 RepID=UPI0008D9F1AF|nr:redox-sensing transcriptional repressor Rex [Peptoniphilus lacydonensis]MBS6610486.1 redox-sensing transcriptional repressor Rex [Peptoniphilus harei]MDU1954873.1 redox-sensing transcriptional repressor Rex [Peptoniphilus lacydonensis]MDU5274320.1 redox-sensing transcriptional repressor Rex [Peptoniphilus lacydonensis]MDU5377450.1 redox-sensing transcriptional repressor Rex [Peptoniphilus lacydonensis]MDU5436267.1 redox-sensing transcriptional repressor Rex [Peptoniphilus lacydonensis]
MLKDTRRISETVIRRMPVYHRYLKELIDTGIERVSSKELSGMTGFSASQIRQDLNNFGGFGQQGYGYNTRALKEQIDKILGIDKSYNSIVIGAGRLGQAIARYNGFRESGFNVISLFDIKDDIDDISGIKVRNMKSLEEYIKKKDVDVAIITVPKESCEDVARRAINAGVKGIWNFAPYDLKGPEGVVVENIRLNDSLLTLSYFMKEIG